jgi:hypothetical protein
MKNESSAYNAIVKNGWSDLIENLKRKGHLWTDFDNVRKEAEKYKTRREFKLKSFGAYYSALKNNWLDEVTKHMETQFVWTKNLVNDIPPEERFSFYYNGTVHAIDQMIVSDSIYNSIKQFYNSSSNITDDLTKHKEYIIYNDALDVQYWTLKLGIDLFSDHNPLLCRIPL